MLPITVGSSRTTSPLRLSTNRRRSLEATITEPSSDCEAYSQPPVAVTWKLLAPSELVSQMSPALR